MPSRNHREDDGWPVNVALCEVAIHKQDEYIFKEAPSFVDEVVKATAAKVDNNHQTGTLDYLCRKGCPRRELLYLLGMCENRGITNCTKMTGHSSDELRNLLKDVRGLADDLWALSGYEFGRFLEMEERSTLFGFLRLPEMLHEYSALVHHAVKYLGGKSDFYLHLAKALLVQFVSTHAKGAYDAKVASLLSVMLGVDYGEVHHRMWRSKYEKRRRSYRSEFNSPTPRLGAILFEPNVPSQSPWLRAKTNLLECHAAILYRMDILHPGKQHLRKKGRTVLRSN